MAAEIYRTSGANIKTIVSGLLLVAGLGFAAFANQFAIKQHLIGSTLQFWGDKHFDRIWFSNDGSLIGASARGSTVSVERLGRFGGVSQSWQVDVAQAVSGADLQSEWVVDGEAQRMAHIAPLGLVVRPLCEPGAGGCAGQRFNLPVATRSVVAFSFVPGRMFASAFTDGTVLFWDTETGNQIAKLSLNHEISQGRWNGGYLAVHNAQGGVARLYRVAEGPKLNMIEETKPPASNFQLVTPGSGQMGYLVGGVLYYRGAIRNSPGPLKAAAIGANDLIVGAGDFNGLVVLASNEDPYPLLEGETENRFRANTLAANSTKFAHSGVTGTGVATLSTESRVTPSGRKLNFLGLGLAVIGGLLACSSFLFELVGMSFQAKGVGSKSKRNLLEPSAELINAFRDGQVVLWAGAGLSAQNSFPVRSALMLQLLQTADNETWLESPRIMNMFERHQQGKHEEVLDEFIETLQYQRPVIIQFFQSVYSRFSAVSACHKHLKRLPVAAAITTNYDVSLEALGPLWANNVVTMRQGAHRGAAERDQFFLLRLYGDPRVPTQVVLSRKEFTLALGQDPTLGDTLQRLFDSKVMLFLGCSPDCLLADLKMMPKIKKSKQKHYAVIAASTRGWEKSTEQLAVEYGIDCVVCSEETIAAELPKFIQTLADQVELQKAEAISRPLNVVGDSVRKAANG